MRPHALGARHHDLRLELALQWRVLDEARRLAQQRGEPAKQCARREPRRAPPRRAQLRGQRGVRHELRYLSKLGRVRRVLDLLRRLMAQALVHCMPEELLVLAEARVVRIQQPLGDVRGQVSSAKVVRNPEYEKGGVPAAHDPVVVLPLVRHHLAHRCPPRPCRGRGSCRVRGGNSGGSSGSGRMGGSGSGCGSPGRGCAGNARSSNGGGGSGGGGRGHIPPGGGGSGSQRNRGSTPRGRGTG